MAKLSKTAQSGKAPIVFLGRCQHCLDNAYLNSDCSWQRDTDCLIRRARLALQESHPK